MCVVHVLGFHNLNNTIYVLCNFMYLYYQWNPNTYTEKRRKVILWWCFFMNETSENIHNSSIWIKTKISHVFFHRTWKNQIMLRPTYFKIHQIVFNRENWTIFYEKKKKIKYHFFAHHPTFFLWLLRLKIQRLISRFITSFMLKFMLNYAICNSEANRTIVKLIAKQLKCMKKKVAIYRKKSTYNSPPPKI